MRRCREVRRGGVDDKGLRIGRSLFAQVDDEKIAKALGPIARAARAKVVPLSIGLPDDSKLTNADLAHVVTLPAV